MELIQQLNPETQDGRCSIAHFFLYFPRREPGNNYRADDEKEESKQHYNRQIREFNSCVILHPHSKKQIHNTNWISALGLVILDIGRYAQSNSIPLCFPESKGWNHSKDLSRIVYFEPKSKEDIKS